MKKMMLILVAGFFLLIRTDLYACEPIIQFNVEESIQVGKQLIVKSRATVEPDARFGVVNVISHHNEYGSFLRLLRSRGTKDSIQAITDGDSIGYLDIWAFDGTYYRRSAQLEVKVDGPVSTDLIPTMFIFKTQDTSGTFDTRMVIKNNGNVGIGTTTPAEKLEVAGRVKAQEFITGDITFQKDGEKLWRMFEDEDGLYIENLKTGKVYRFVLQEVER